MKKGIVMFAVLFLVLTAVQITPAKTLNNPPEKPTINGPTSGEAGKSYTYTAVSTDPDGDKIFYCFNWGDGNEICTDLYPSGQQASASHTWESKGDYTITVKATDEHGAESEPATLKVSMPLVFSKTQFTHTVLAELGSTSWCPNCPRADERIYETYSSGNYPFYYVTLVYDLNSIAQKRGRQLSDSYIPMLYLDGGYEIVDNTANYASSIANVAEREVNPISLDVSASWQGNAKIDVSVSITNEGSQSYFGHLRVYVTEITSRWNDEKGNPYHYAFLDYAFDKYVKIQAGDTYTETSTWDGSANHGGQTYGDIDPNNIMVIASISHWLPHLQKNPWTTPRPFRFLAQFVDQTNASLVTSSAIEKNKSLKEIHLLGREILPSWVIS